MEKHLATYGLGEGKGKEKLNQNMDPDEDDYLDWNGFICKRQMVGVQIRIPHPID